MKISSKLNELKRTDLNCNVFDVYSYDGLSMQELLCQFFTKISECIKISNETIDLASWLVNEGLKIEVVNKLMLWLEDGTLENLINVNLFNTLHTKIENINTHLAHIENKIDTVVYAIDYKKDNNTWDEAINSAINSVDSGTVILPSGSIELENAIKIKSNITLRGQGVNSTVLKITNTHGITCDNNSYLRFVALENFCINGNNNGNLDLFSVDNCGIFLQSEYEVYQCVFKNIRIQNVKGNGIYIPYDFNNLFENISISYVGGNGIEVNGIITDTFINCYVDYVANGKCGYRIYEKAHMISCNGLGGNGEYWGVFGREQDGRFELIPTKKPSQHYIILDQCNIEDFTKVGLKFIYTGGFNLRNTSFLVNPHIPSFDCFVEFTNISKMSEIDGLTTMQKTTSQMSCSSNLKSSIPQASIVSYNSDINNFYVPNVGLVKIPVLGKASYSYLENHLLLSNVNIENMHSYVLGTNKNTYGDSKPTSGTWKSGDKVWKTSCFENGDFGNLYIVLGWVCVEGGTPGQWREMRVYTGN